MITVAVAIFATVTVANVKFTMEKFATVMVAKVSW